MLCSPSFTLSIPSAAACPSHPSSFGVHHPLFVSRRVGCFGFSIKNLLLVLLGVIQGGHRSPCLVCEGRLCPMHPPHSTGCPAAAVLPSWAWCFPGLGHQPGPRHPHHFTLAALKSAVTFHGQFEIADLKDACPWPLPLPLVPFALQMALASSPCPCHPAPPKGDPKEMPPHIVLCMGLLPRTTSPPPQGIPMATVPPWPGSLTGRR